MGTGLARRVCYVAGVQLDAYRAEFTAGPRYLNFAGIGPMSNRAMARIAEHAAVLMPTDEKPIPRLLELLEESRRIGGMLLRTDAEHVMYASSTSHGLFSVAFGLRPGNVVVPANEFPANKYPWIRAAEAGHGEVRLVDLPDGRLTPEALRPYVDGETRAVALSAISYSTGFRADLEAIRSVCGDALLVVDTVQASGAWDVTMDHVDVAVVGPQKWMRAGLGAALVGYSSRALEQIAPTLGGWTGVEDMFGPAPVPHPVLSDAARYGMGSAPFVAMGGMRGSIEVTLEAGLPAIEAAMAERVTVFEEALLAAGAQLGGRGFGAGEKSTIFTFSMPGHSTSAVMAMLDAEGFVVEERDGLTRVSPHATTPLETADDLRKALETLN
jgi:selenocysteine lyase/cysteine desulfurase